MFELLKNRSSTILSQPIGRMNCCCRRQGFLEQQEEEKDSLLLAASQDYKKVMWPAKTNDDVQSAVVAQVL